jgi:hypothetical protein
MSDGCRRWLATARTKFCQVDSVLVQSDAPDGAPEPLARFADEWSSRFGLVSAWSFADEDNLRVGAALAHDSLAHSASLALPTGLDLPRNLLQGRVLVR